MLLVNLLQATHTLLTLCMVRLGGGSGCVDRIQLPEDAPQQLLSHGLWCAKLTACACVPRSVQCYSKPQQRACVNFKPQYCCFIHPASQSLKHTCKLLAEATPSSTLMPIQHTGIQCINNCTHRDDPAQAAPCTHSGAPPRRSKPIPTSTLPSSVRAEMLCVAQEPCGSLALQNPFPTHNPGTSR